VTEYPLLCINPGCRPDDHGGPRRTERAWYCPACIDRAARQLNDIADAWDDLEERLTSSEVIGGEQGKTKNAGKGATGLIVNEQAVNARRAATAHVWSFARIVFDWADSLDRSIAGPRHQTTPEVARWIAKWHVNVFAVHAGRTTALAFIEDTGDVRRAVRSAAYPSGARKVETELPCTEHGTSELGERIPCDGMMVAWVSPDAKCLPDLVCTADKTHTIDPTTWQTNGWKRAHARPMSREAMTRLAHVMTS
jgi:hypothetical protein